MSPRQGLIASLLASPAPDAAIEIAPARVSAATPAPRGAAAAIQAYASEDLPEGAIQPSLTTQNIVEPAAVTAAIRNVLDRVGAAGGRVALIIPDVSTKVSVVRFEHVPGRRDDLDQLIRWQVRKAAPFPIEEACVSYTAGGPVSDGGGEFVVVLARQDVVREYENVCTAAGAYAGLVDIATFSIVNLALASPAARDGDSLIVHMRPEYTSVAIVRNGAVIFFRNRPEGDEETLADVVHQTAMYYQDRLSGSGFSRLLLGGSGRAAGSVEQARRDLQNRLGTRVEPIDAPALVALGDASGPAAGAGDLIGPLAGMILRMRGEMAGA